MTLLYTFAGFPEIAASPCDRRRRAIALLVLLCNLWPGAADCVLAREAFRLSNPWKFHWQDVAHNNQPDIDPSGWRTVRLPHDWSIESATNPRALSSGGGGFFATGVGWYRYEFVPPEHWQNQRVSVEFEGVYRNAKVWINDVVLGQHPSGYTPFRYDLTEHLRYGRPNVLQVRVDNSRQPNSRWYSGSGIYRPVWIRVTDAVHFDESTISISTREAALEQARIAAEVTVKNESDEDAVVTLHTDMWDPNRKLVASVKRDLSVPAGAQQTIGQELTIARPSLWSPESPSLYTAAFRLCREEDDSDQSMLPFGIRTVAVSSARGFLLNGKERWLCGANVHHDHGLLGAAVFDRAETRRVECLKAAGFNAVRTAHNPPSTAFLNACDRLGLLVVLEAFDGWAENKIPHDYGDVFQDGWQRDLQTTILRDRNHPSVIMWSIGNEMYERGNEQGLRIARAMRELIHRLDTARPVTAGVNGLGSSGDWTQLDPLFATLDVAGYNYELQRHEEDHVRLPERVIMSTESYPADAFDGWYATCRFPYVIGDFVWSGVDYLGEAGIGRVFQPREHVVPHWQGQHYPWHGAACGDIDPTGWRKPISHYRNIVWDRGEKLFVTVHVPPPDSGSWKLSAWASPPTLPSWTWPGDAGRKLKVQVYSRYPRVRLYLNGQLLGERPTTSAEKFSTEFHTTYVPGTLRAVGLESGREQEECTLTTAGEPRGIRLSPDRATICAGDQDLSFVTVEVVDGQGQWCPQAKTPLTYLLRGPGVIAGIGSGDLSTRESYRDNPRSVFQGRAVVAVRPTDDTGTIALQVAGPGLQPATTEIHVQTTDAR